MNCIQTGYLTILFVIPTQKTMRLFIVLPDTRITLQNHPFVYNRTHLGKRSLHFNKRASRRKREMILYTCRPYRFL